MAKTTEARKDFFTSATRMTLAQLKSFFENVLLKMDPKKARPVIIWGAPGVAKSSILEQIFLPSEKGLKTVILSQISALDSNGMPNINDFGSTEFTPTETFGRGKFNLFLDELNNAQGTTLACIQNLLSSRQMGGDDYSNVYIVAACNPPSTNNLAQDLNQPTVSRCLNIVLDYTVEDFVNYALETGTIHPAITAFHKKTSGQYLQASWDYLVSSNYSVPEPSQNEPYPCPRSWSMASDFMFALGGGKASGTVSYEMLRPVIEGTVGITAATAFAQTYAYMTKIPDIEAIFDGKNDAEKNPLSDEVAVHYITMMGVVNYCINQIEEAKRANVQARFDNADGKGFKLLAGLHRSIRFLGQAASSEIATMAAGSVVTKVRATLTENFIGQLFRGIDPKKGLTRDDFVKWSRQNADSRETIDSQIG